GGGCAPKQCGVGAKEPVIRPSLATLAPHPGIAVVQPVIHSDDVARFEDAAAGLKVLPPVFGAATRQGSVRAGLEALASHKPDRVLVHDAARPFASEALITRAIAAAKSGAAVPVLPVVDTVKTVDAAGVIIGTIDRTPL